MNVVAGEKTTLESQKVQEYVAECFQHAESSDNNQRMFIIYIQHAHLQPFHVCRHHLPLECTINTLSRALSPILPIPDAIFLSRLTSLLPFPRVLTILHFLKERELQKRQTNHPREFHYS